MINSLRLALRCNFPLGIFHRIRGSFYGKNKIPRYAISTTEDLFSIGAAENKRRFSNFFLSDQDQEKKLIRIASEFCEGFVTIYGKRILLSNFAVNKFKKNIAEKHVFFRDIRFYWELYRAKYVYNVGLAYLLTGNEAYAKALLDHILELDSFNPLCGNDMPYNGMEVALRLMNLSWLDIFLADFSGYISEVRERLISGLVYHAEYIYKNYDITFYGLESNHGLTCAVGLVYASLLFSNYSRAGKWRNFGMRALRRGLKKQFTPDGVNFESSVQYHRFVFELLVFILAALYKSGIAVDREIERRVRQMGEALRALTHKNGCISRIGDSDGGKFLPDLGSTEEFNDMSYLDWFFLEQSPPRYETLLFEGIAPLKALFRSSGCKAMRRHRYGNYVSYKNQDVSLIISANEIGTRGKGNHQHNDFLSFELYSTFPFIVDPWSYCYTGNKELRNEDRKTYRHNTVELDGRDIVEFDENRLFEMLSNIKTKIGNLYENESIWGVELYHNGYRGLPKGSQIHSRKFIIDRKICQLVIQDHLGGRGSHIARFNFHIPKRYWLFKRHEDCLHFFNNMWEFSLRNDVSEFAVAESFISDWFLEKTPSYHVFFKKKYVDSLVCNLTITYRRKAGNNKRETQ